MAAGGVVRQLMIHRHDALFLRVPILSGPTGERVTLDALTALASPGPGAGDPVPGIIHPPAPADLFTVAFPAGSLDGADRWSILVRMVRGARAHTDQVASLRVDPTPFAPIALGSDYSLDYSLDYGG